MRMSRTSRDESDDETFTDPDESGLRSGKGPALLSRLFGKY